LALVPGRRVKNEFSNTMERKMTVETEADDVIRARDMDLLRIHLTAEDMIVTETENYPQRHVIICDSSEAKQLRDWLTRRSEDEKREIRRRGRAPGQPRIPKREWSV
jgi:hypothetical protein